ncbi:MAG: hypothetical protein EOO38_15800 [Cytophagaceae bacterium]|nr:MAG: hypothetical protein EOO38_15800 [Cytophagaceae bacterium]
MNAAASCLPPSQSSGSTKTVATNSNTLSNNPAALTQADLDSLQVSGVIGSGFHNFYLVATLTSPPVSSGRTVALHMWLSKPQYDTPGQAHAVAGTVSVLSPGKAGQPCTAVWYPATITYALSAPSVEAAVTTAAGHFSVGVDGVGTHAGLFATSSTASLPAGADVEACNQTIVGVLPDFHSNAPPINLGSNAANSAGPTQASASAEQLPNPEAYIYACPTESGSFPSTTGGPATGDQNGYVVGRGILFTRDANICYRKSVPSGTLTVLARYTYLDGSTVQPTAVQKAASVTLGNTPPLCATGTGCVTTQCSPTSAVSTTTGTLVLPGADGALTATGSATLQATLPATATAAAQLLSLKANLIGDGTAISTFSGGNAPPPTIPCSSGAASRP